MLRKLKENERLIYAGDTAHRSPSGKLLPGIPQYIIVPVDEADPDCVIELRDNECLVLAATMDGHDNLQSARERFAALKAGKPPPPQSKTKPIDIYFKEITENINQATGLTRGQEKIFEKLAYDLTLELKASQAKHQKRYRLKKIYKSQCKGATVVSYLRAARMPSRVTQFPTALY